MFTVQDFTCITFLSNEFSFLTCFAWYYMIYQYISSVLSMLWLFVYTILHCSMIDFFLQIWKNLYYTKIIIHSENNEEAWFFNRQVFIAAPGTPPRYVIAKALNPRTVEVSWLPPEKPNGVIQVVAISHIKNTRIFYNYGIFFFLIIWGFFPPDICFDQNSKIIFSLYQ